MSTLAKKTELREVNDNPKILTPHSEHADWLSKEELSTLTVPEIVRRVAALQPLIASMARESELLREPVPEVWSAIRKTGIFYLMVPRAYGGLEADLQAFIEVIIPIAEEDASLAWTTAFSVMHQWQLAQFPKRAQDELWAKLPYITSAGAAFPPSTAVKVEGGYRLSGMHRYVSGVMHAEWINSFAMLEDGTRLLCMFPIENAEVRDTWNTDGMSGTGSHDIVFNDVFVPDYLAAEVEAMRQGQFIYETPAYRIPFSLFLALVIAVPPLGALRGEIKRFRKRLSSPGPDGKIADRPIARAALSRSDVDERSTELLLRDTAKFAEDIVVDRPLSLGDRVRVRAQLSYATQKCLASLRSLSDLSGSSAHFHSIPTQRALRDVTMIATHATIDINSALEEYAREMTGLEPSWWLA